MLVWLISSSIPVFFSSTTPHVNNNVYFSDISTSQLAGILVLMFRLYHLNYFKLVMEMSPALGEASKDVNSYKCCLLIVTCNPDK